MTNVQPKLIRVAGNSPETIRIQLSPAVKRRLLNIGSPIGFLVLWQMADLLRIVNPQFIPSPVTIVHAFVLDAVSGQLWGDLSISLYRIFMGFLIGAVPGVIIGLSSGLSAYVRMFVDPFVAATYPIPKLALTPLFMLIFGLTNTAKVLLIASGVVFPIVINLSSGVMAMDKQYREVAQNFGASRMSFIWTVAIPGSLPMLFSGLKLALGEALLLIVAAEMIGAQHGIGYRIWEAYDVINMPLMFVSFVVIALLGYIFTTFLDELEHWLIPWNHKR